MRGRVEELVGGVSRLMWVMTFHSSCARILRANAERLGYKRSFTIYDEADSMRMVKRCMEEADVDNKRFPPRAVRSQISAAKNQLIDAHDFRERQGSFFEETVADVYELYERRMVNASAMDFDDLLVRTVNLLELDRRRLGEVTLEVEDVADVGGPEPVDGLRLVADDEQVAVLAAEQLQQPVLDPVRVLVLVDEDVPEVPGVALAEIGEKRGPSSAGG
jgi:hypothetical protein